MEQALSPRQAYIRRLNTLINERAEVLAHCRELAANIDPLNSQFDVWNRNKPPSNAAIYSSVPANALETITNGIFTNASSPSNPWYRLTTQDPALAEQAEVREFIYLLEDTSRVVLKKSNVYNCLQQVDKDLVQFGFSALHLDADDETVIRGYVYPVGTYCLAANFRGQVSTIYRELTLTVEQMVEQFGIEAVSKSVRDQWNRRNYDAPIQIVHVIEPNRARILGARGLGGMAYKSCWLEKNGNDKQGLLRESGYAEMPTLCPRWSVRAGNVYGFGLGTIALPDIKSLHQASRDKLKLVGKITNPPLMGPPGLDRASQMPGAYNTLTSTTAGAKIEPLYMPHPNSLAEARAIERDLEIAVNRAFKADQWLSLQSKEGKAMTAREVAELAQEKLAQLGPAMERSQSELYGPLINLVLRHIFEAELVPEIPEVLQGQEYKIEFISGVAQAQKVGGAFGLDRVVEFATKIAALDPSAAQKINGAEMIDKYSEALGNDPSVIRNDEEMGEIVAAQAEAAEAERAGAAVVAGAGAVKDLAGANLEDPSALTAIASRFAGGQA